MPCSPGSESRMDTHTDQVIILVSLGLGLWLVGNSAYLLVSS